MPRPAHVPPELVGAPFTSGMALAAGLTRSRLRSKCWRRLFRDVYVHVSVPDTQELRIAAVRLIAPLHAVISGLTAAWIYGVDLRHRNRLDCEVTVEKGRGLDPRPGLRVRHGQLPDKDLFHFDGVVVMSPERTALDLAKRGPLTERVVALDAMLHAGVVDRAGLRAAFAGRRRWRGIRGAREALDHADGRSESPMESRLRMLLVLAGLPRPEVQWEVRDRVGLLVARFDLAYPQYRLAIEYDGAHHAVVRAGDRRRDNSVVFIAGQRWGILRFAADDYYRLADAIVAIVRQALATPV